MKTKLHTLLITALVALSLPLSAQSLIPKTEGQQIAERIDSQQLELLNHIEQQLKAFHSVVNTPGKQQAILDALGTNATTALQRYVAMRGLLLQLKPNATVPEPNLTVFVPNQDGTVTYVAPPPPELEE